MGKPGDKKCARHFDYDFMNEIKTVLLSLTPTGFYYRNRPDNKTSPESAGADAMETYTPPHNHPFKEICMTLDGSNYIQLDEHIYKINAGNVCYIESCTFHGTLFEPVNNDCCILWIALDGSRVRMHISIYRNHEYRIIDGIDMKMDNYLIEQIEEELEKRDTGYPEYCISYFQAYWNILFRKFVRMADSRNTGKTPWKNKVVLEVEDYIINHISEKISLKDISDAISLSPNYLSFLFREVKGVNLFEYIQDKKVCKAKELLRVSEGNISEIAYMLGFSDPFYFTKVFKRSTGMSPRDYRESLSMQT